MAFGGGGGGWIATPLPATHVHKLRPCMIIITSFTTCYNYSYSALRMREAGVEMPKRTRKPSLKVRENLQFQDKKKAKGLYLPLSIIPSTIQATYQILRSILKYKPKRTTKVKKQIVKPARGMSSLKTSSLVLEWLSLSY